MDTPLDKKSSVDEIREHFDNDVERFSVLETGQQATIDAPLAMALITQAAIAVKPDSQNVLDIGCGAGNNTLKLLQYKNPLNCHLLDISEPMLNRANERISAANKGSVRTFLGDIRTVELPNANYDIIIAAAVLHHLRDDQDWETVFTKIYNLTAPGGSFWITDLIFHDNPIVQQLMWKRYGEYLESLGGVENKERVFGYIDKEDSPRSLNYQTLLLRKVGFDEVEILHKNSCYAAFGAVKKL